MVRILSDAAVADCLDLGDLLPVVREAFVKQGRGEVERPERPHFPVGVGLDSLDSRDDAESCGTGLVMPAYLHGAEFYATKLVGVHDGNAEQGLPTVNAQIALTEAETGLPAGYLAGTRLTNARTGCIGGLAVAELAVADRAAESSAADSADAPETEAPDSAVASETTNGPENGDAPESAAAPDSGVTLALVGAGTQARWQARAIAAATDFGSGAAPESTPGFESAPDLEAVRVYSPSDSKRDCAADLRAELALPAEAITAADSPEEAVSGANVVVTATTATEPVFPGAALDPGALVVAVGAYDDEMRELDAETFERAGRVFADVPGEVAEVGDVLGADVAEADLVALSAVLEGEAGRESEDEILVVESVGTAVLDAAAAEYVFEEAEEQGVGTEVPL